MRNMSILGFGFSLIWLDLWSTEPKKSGCASFRFRRSCGPWLDTFLCQKKNWFSFFSWASKNVFGNFQYCLEGHKGNSHSETINNDLFGKLLLAYFGWCLYLFVFSALQTMTQRIFFISVSKEVATMNPPESFDFMINLIRLWSCVFSRGLGCQEMVINFVILSDFDAEDVQKEKLLLAKWQQHKMTTVSQWSENSQIVFYF